MTEEFKIEKGIPMPPVVKNGIAEKKYPWLQMEVGDSFLIPDKPSRAVGSLIASHNRNGKRFACRTVEGGTRVWRME